jgi:hypothetical protein
MATIDWKIVWLNYHNIQGCWMGIFQKSLQILFLHLDFRNDFKRKKEQQIKHQKQRSVRVISLKRSTKQSFK